MINMQTISEEIAKLEESQASFPVCQKLADLYIVRDHLMQKQGGNYEQYNRSDYGYYERGGNSGNNRMMDNTDNRPRMSNPSMR